MKSFLICTALQILFRCTNEGSEMGGACGTYGERRNPLRLLGKLKEGHDAECLGVDGRMILNGFLMTRLHVGRSGFRISVAARHFLFFRN